MPRNGQAAFFVFEGPDGSGQTTQVQLLKDYLEQKNKSVLKTKEPTNRSSVSKKIRDVLEKQEKTDPLELQKLFTKDRREHLEKIILPALTSGKIVISDRYFFSTFAFGSLECRLNKLIELNKNFLYPDLTFFLKTSSGTCLERILKRGKNVQFFEEKEKLEKVMKAYEELNHKFPDIKIIDAERDITTTYKEIVKLVEDKLENL